MRDERKKIEQFIHSICQYKFWYDSRKFELQNILIILFALHEKSEIGLCMKYQHETSNQIYALPSCESFGYFLQPNINQAVIILRFAICIVLITSKTIYVPLVA